MTGRLLAVDPGFEQSAWVVYDREERRPVEWGKDLNARALGKAGHASVSLLAVEMIASYGMPVGAEVFETCVFVGRLIERWLARSYTEPLRVYRRDVKLHLCGSNRAKDSHVRQALIDRYGPGRSAAVGVKASPGPLYGMKADVWQALAVAVTADETMLTQCEGLAA